MFTLPELEKRHSVRSFDGKPLSESDARNLRAEITMINSHEAGLFFSLVTGDGKPFDGFSASYGFFRGVDNYIVAAIDEHFPDARERAGYYAQQLVMQAQALGLSSCYVGGTYSEKNVDATLRSGQKVIFIIALGKASGRDSLIVDLAMKIAHRKKMDFREFYEATPAWPLDKASAVFPFLVEGLKAVACAPSSLNKRPTRIVVEESEQGPRVCAHVPETNPKNLTDLGIAKFNFQCVAGGIWDWGNGAPFIAD